jgi:dephospho-CoA kinase
LMEPGQVVYHGIVAHFGDSVLLDDGRLDRSALARIAFAEGRVEDLNAIVHPAVIAWQAAWSREIFAKNPHAVVMVESALIFETNHTETSYSETGHSAAIRGGDSQGAGGTRWSRRFDRLILVTAPEEVKIARFVARSAAGLALSAERRAELEADARRRLAQQIPDEQKSALCDYVLTNGGALTELEWQVDHLWPILQAAAG